MVDLGVKFGDDSDPALMWFSRCFIHSAKNRKKLAGLILTHGHEDHWRRAMAVAATQMPRLLHALCRRTLEQQAEGTRA
jgi:mRNA degradation ribonuclease J1/J2